MGGRAESDRAAGRIQPRAGKAPIRPVTFRSAGESLRTISQVLRCRRALCAMDMAYLPRKPRPACLLNWSLGTSSWRGPYTPLQLSAKPILLVSVSLRNSVLSQGNRCLSSRDAPVPLDVSWEVSAKEFCSLGFVFDRIDA